MLRLLVLVALACGAGLPLPLQAPPLPPLGRLYAVAAAKLLGPAGDQEFVVLPTAPRPELSVRARRGSGEAHTASLATAREVVRLLTRQGYRGAAGVRTKVVRDGALQLTLGELRFEPPRDPNFARLAIEVVGSDGSAVAIELLLKREADEWRVIRMKSKDDVR